MLDAVAQRVRSAGLAFEVLRASRRRARALVDLDRLVEHDRRRRVAVVERRRVDERLEGRARLAHRLRRAVELRLVEREAADHGEDAAGIGVHRDDGAARLRGSGAAGTVRACRRSARHRSTSPGVQRRCAPVPPRPVHARLDHGRRSARSRSTLPSGSLAFGCRPMRASLPFMSSTTASCQGCTSPSAGTSASGSAPVARDLDVAHRRRGSHAPRRSARDRRPAPCGR